MLIKPIRNDDDLTQAFKRLETIFQAETWTAEFDEMEVLVTLIEAYENKHFSIQHAEPVAAILFQMEQLNLMQKDLEPYLGVPSKVSEILNKKRSLSLNMIRKLHHGLNIPYESLIH